jgi:trans-aconitate methyltransferase
VAQEVIDDLTSRRRDRARRWVSGSVTFDLWGSSRGKIIALDSSPQMVEQLSDDRRARDYEHRGAAGGPRKLRIAEPVDVVFSNAVFY